jgi:hypothetical protein
MPMQPFQPQSRTTELARHPHRVELRGALRRIAWPALCPNCGAPAHERIHVRKVFRRVGGHRTGPALYPIAGADIPFCAECARSHRAAAPGMTPLEYALSHLRTPAVVALLGASVAALFTLKLALGAAPGEARTLGLAIFGFFALAWVASAVEVCRQTRRFRVPPPTTVTRACDFSDDLGNLFEGERRVYAIRDPAFAEALVAANQDRVWTSGDRARSRWRWGVIAGAVMALMVCTWLWRHLGAP